MARFDTLTQHVCTAKNCYQEIGLMLLGRDPAFSVLGFWSVVRVGTPLAISGTPGG